MKATQELVYKAIADERSYQDRKWNHQTTPSGGQHPIGSWLTFIADYLREAQSQISRNADPQASNEALGTIRKIAAMCVACMEQNGVRTRQEVEALSKPPAGPKNDPIGLTGLKVYTETITGLPLSGMSGTVVTVDGAMPFGTLAKKN